MPSLSNIIAKLTIAGTDFIFPPACHYCASPIEKGAIVHLCPACLGQLSETNKNFCSICSVVVGPHLETSSGCFYCQNEKYSFRRATALGNHVGFLKSVVLQAKLQRDNPLLYSLSQLLADRITRSDQNDASNLIIPIPQHWTDRILYPFHAPVTLSNHLSHLLKQPANSNILQLRQRTVRQHTLQGAERRQNLRDAFYISPRINLKGAKIILVDDVMTTGTTCNRATQQLLKAGAEDVCVAVLARGIGLKSSIR